MIVEDKDEALRVCEWVAHLAPWANNLYTCCLSLQKCVYALCTCIYVYLALRCICDVPTHVRSEVVCCARSHCVFGVLLKMEEVLLLWHCHCVMQTHPEEMKSLHYVLSNKLVGWGNPRQGNTRLIMQCYSPLAQINNLHCLFAFTPLPREARNSRTEAEEKGER